MPSPQGASCVSAMISMAAKRPECPMNPLCRRPPLYQASHPVCHVRHRRSSTEMKLIHYPPLSRCLAALDSHTRTKNVIGFNVHHCSAGKVHSE